jgi:hypothetical protein
MTKQGYLLLGGSQFDAFEDWKLIYPGSREEPADYELVSRELFINGRSVSPEKYRELFDYVLEKGS